MKDINHESEKSEKEPFLNKIKNKNEFKFSNMLQNYIEYDLSKTKDYKGGYIIEEKPNSKLQEPKFNQIMKQNVIFDPPISFNPFDNIKCKECGSVELDFQFLKIFNTRVCCKCKKTFPDKYSLLTKTECKNDYLLTDSELHDKEILPYMEKSNPRKSEWNTMKLFLRYQVEEFAWKKWGGPENLDMEWERRVKEKKLKKSMRLEKKIEELKKRIRTSQYIEKNKDKKTKHIHNFSQPIINPSTELITKKCACGFKIEEIFM